MMYLQRRRRTTVLRLLAAIFAILCCFLLGSFTVSVPRRVHAGPIQRTAVVGPQESSPEAQYLAARDAKPEPAEEQIDESKPFVGHSIRDGDLFRFKTALRDVLAMLPDEMHIREILRPIEGTGNQRLREIGLRTKAYKSFFEAWEALHVVSDDNFTYVRDDVLLYLRHAEDLRDISFMSRADIMRAYEAYRYFLVNLADLLFPWTKPYFADHMSLHASFHHGGRGIVMSGNDEQAPFMLTGIKSIRKLGCGLPIEIMYLGEEDLGEDYRAELEAIDGVVCRDMSQMVRDNGWKLAGWAGKPFAILNSSFREVLFIDADALFFRNPELLFEDPAYAKTGALFFRDRLVSPESKKRWLQSILPKPISKSVRSSRLWTGDSGHQQESGVIVVDKWRHFMAMLLVTRMNGPERDSDHDKGIIGIYDMVYGDKETFWLGWELVGDLDYAFHQGDAGIMGVLQDPSEADANTLKTALSDLNRDNGTSSLDAETPSNFTVCAPQLVHLDLKGRPFWFNGWLLNNKFNDKHKHEKAGTFEIFMAEPRDVREPGAWQIGEHNMCCLTADAWQYFTEDERKNLDMLINVAREVGAVA
ncbi:hypothetical protein H2203_002949 [Taxawa tesnikishii (nom. ined.)]|nr:hypothetical protein H2203_002949 [Dothideales sp. JES 119]